MDDSLSTSQLPKLPPRDSSSHKGDFGTALIIGGSRGMAGSISLAGLAAARTGAGRVRLAVPDVILETVAGFHPSAMTIPLPNDAEGLIACSGNRLAELIATSTCIAIGPGIGTGEQVQRFVIGVLELAGDVGRPVVVDADALNCIALAKFDWLSFSGDLIITPHPGEWKRLSQTSTKDRSAQVESAVAMAGRSRATIVLKGEKTLIAKGNWHVFNSTGTPAMATGGSGDVLTGVIAALVCQGLSPVDAAHLGVHVHGLAAEMAEHELATHVVLPTELIDYLPKAFRQVR